MILALDLATRTGWAVAHPKSYVPTQIEARAKEKEDPITVSGVWQLDKDDKKARLVGLWREINQVGKQHKITSIVSEAPFVGPSARVIMALSELHGAARLLAGLHRIPYHLVRPNELKQFATGHGAATKQMMIDTGTERGWQVVDDNEADARWLALFACAMKW